LIYFKLKSDLSPTDTSASDGFGTFPFHYALNDKKGQIKGGCQGFSGPFPSAFLDKFIPSEAGNLPIIRNL
jgi:hypothetical protein